MARVPAPWIKGVPRGSPRGLRISANNAGEHKDVSVVLLAGGRGKRMGAPIPKQYLEVRDKPLATRSFYALANIPSVLEMVVVCEPEFEHVFPRELPGTQTEVKFARPGEERQDSVFSGYSVVANDASLVCIHDSARPLVDPSRADAAVEDARQHGCSALGAPVKATIKQADPDSLMVSRYSPSPLFGAHRRCFALHIALRHGAGRWIGAPCGRCTRPRWLKAGRWERHWARRRGWALS